MGVTSDVRRRERAVPEGLVSVLSPSLPLPPPLSPPHSLPLLSHVMADAGHKAGQTRRAIAA
eukprot:2654937-Pleurochrysis_carterae.AAC.1